MLDKKDKRIFHKKIKDLTNEEKDFIKSYTTNNIYMLHGLYNGPNIFNDYNKKHYFTNTLELFIFISSNTKLIVSIINSFLDVIFILLIILIIILYFLY